MSKFLLFVTVVVLLAILACGGDDATEAPPNTAPPQPTEVATAMVEPTPTPEPTNTQVPVPTSTPAPANTPVPEPTSTPMPDDPPSEVEPGQIMPLKLDDPLKIAGELSQDELACAAGVADISRLMAIFAAPETGTPEELTRLFACFEDETVLRMFVTTLIGLEDPLSGEASACVRTGMEAIDPRTVMLSGIEGDPGAAMAGSMSAFLLVVSCLNEEEFAAAAPSLGVPVDDREGLLCLVDELGGPEMFAAAFTGQDEDAMMALIGAGITCGLEMEDAPMPGPAPTAVPVATPQPMATPDAPSRVTMGSGPLAPLPLDDPLAMMAELSENELACLTGSGDVSQLIQSFMGPEPPDPEMAAQMGGCLENETILRLLLTETTSQTGPLGEETSMCIRESTSSIDLGSMFSAGDEENQDAFMGMMAVSMSMALCLSQDESVAASMTPEERESFECFHSELGGTEGLADMMASGDEEALMALFGLMFTCGVSMDSASNPGG